jgi:E3 ubiquitin-protein ligase UBR1
MCAPCFDASDHDGHDVIFSVGTSNGGCCDCGDEEAWTTNVCCKYHAAVDDGFSPSQSEFASASESHRNEDDLDMESGEPSEEMDSAKGKRPDRTTTSFDDHIREVDSLLSTVPIDVKESLLSSVSSMITYILDTMEHAPMEMKLPEGPEVIERIKRQPSLEPEENLPDSADIMSRLASAYSFSSSNHERIYSVVLWNDEKHSFKEVIDTVSGATEKTENMAKAIAERVDKHGRDIIETSAEVKKMYLLAHKLSQIDLAVTVRPAYDIFAEEIAGHVLDFLLDLTSASLFVNPSTSASSVHPLDQLVPNATAMRALIGRALFEPWYHRKLVVRGQMSLDYFDNRNLLQLDGLLLLDNRMWKSARGTCRSIYMALLGPRQVKRALARRFAQMYPKLVETFIIHDREPDHSIRSVTVQLFSVPSIATELVADMNFLYTMMQILQSIFTGQLTPQALTLPPVTTDKMRASPSSLFLRQTRCYHGFYDMRYLLAAQGVQSQLVQQSRHLVYFLDFLALFNAIAPDQRATEEHIEFESEVWMQILHIATHLSKSAKLFGEAFAKANEQELIQGINLIMSKTYHSCSTLGLMDSIHSEIEYRDVTYADAKENVIWFKVEQSGVSFHHPMHWLLAETLKHLDKLDYQSYMQNKGPKLSHLVKDTVGKRELLVVFDFPLRVIVKLAQIRAGMWVRNGFGIRSQAHHYRDNSMRDLLYDQDFYLLQASFAFIPIDQMLINLVTRFSLAEWLQEIKPKSGLELGQYHSLAEEMLLLLVHMLSETSIATKWSMERQIRREIIHFLALSQGTYSELNRHISERLKEHSSFDRILASLSSFRAPDGTYDLGIFELNDDLYDEVQPYFFHYTRNQREKAEQVLKERHKKKYGAKAAESFVAVPGKRLEAGQAIVVDELRQVFRSSVLHEIIFYSLTNAEYDVKDSADNLIDSALQLLMMGLVEQGSDFAVSIRRGLDNRFSLLTFLLEVRQDHERFAPFKAKIEWIINTAVSLDNECRLEVLKIETEQGKLKQGVEVEESIVDKKRAAAKARQAAIMQQFSAQQKSLLETLEDEELSSEEYLDGEEEEDAAMMDYAEDHPQETATLRSFGACIFCQENLDQHKAFGSLAHIQSSRVMRTTPRHDTYSLQQSLQTPLTLDRSDAKGKRIRGDSALPTASHRKWDGFPSEDHRFGFYASTCGHLMHLSCFENYCRNVEQRHSQQIARNHPEDISRSEFVCPLCKSLGNIILPVPKTNLQQNAGPYFVDKTPISDWIRKINIDILKTSTMLQSPQLQEMEHGTGSFLPWYAEDAQALLDSAETSRNASSVPTATRQMLERLVRVLRPMSYKSRAMRQTYQTKTIHAPPSRKMYMPEELIAYTIGMLEIAQRGTTPVQKDDDVVVSQGPLHVADGVSIHTRELVQSLILSLRDIAKVDEDNYQSMMRHGLLMRLLPHWGGHEPVRSPLLLRDPMTILIEASIIAPENLHQITILMFYIQLIQVVFGLAQPSIWPQNNHAPTSRGTASPLGFWKGSNGQSTAVTPIDSGGLSKSDASVLEACFDDVRMTVGNIIGLVGYARGNITLGVDNLDDTSLAKIICTYCLPFLRRVTILQKCMGVLKEETKEVDSAMGGGPEEKSEFIRLMTLLDIPLPKEALPAQHSATSRQTALAGLVEGWIKHAYPQLASIFRPLPIQPSPLSAVSTKNNAGHHPTLQLEHPHIYELIQLPSDLTKLLMQCQLLRCKQCGNLPPEPAICLECGELLCFQSFCCQGSLDGKGECNRHLEECGHSSGLFFKVKTNIITLLFQGNGCFTYSPYLDAHGEVDIGLKKGKIQFLHLVRFDELRKQWLNHGLANIITRKIEAVIDQGGWITM